MPEPKSEWACKLIGNEPCPVARLSAGSRLVVAKMLRSSFSADSVLVQKWSPAKRPNSPFLVQVLGEAVFSGDVNGLVLEDCPAKTLCNLIFNYRLSHAQSSFLPHSLVGLAGHLLTAIMATRANSCLLSYTVLAFGPDSAATLKLLPPKAFFVQDDETCIDAHKKAKPDPSNESKSQDGMPGCL